MGQSYKGTGIPDNRDDRGRTIAGRHDGSSFTAVCVGSVVRTIDEIYVLPYGHAVLDIELGVETHAVPLEPVFKSCTVLVKITNTGIVLGILTST